MMAGILALPSFWSCNDAESPALPNSIYLVDAIDRDEYDCLIKPMRETTYNVTVKMTHKVDHDVKLRMIVDKELLKKHYEDFGEQISLLPTDNWVLYDTDGTPRAGEEMELTFPANQTVAVLPVKILTMENAEESQYALPLTIQAVSDDIHVLENLRSQLFVFQAPFETSAMFFTAKNAALRLPLPNFPSLTEWTLEFHFHIQRGQTQPLYGCPLVSFGPSEIYVRQYHQGGGMDIHILGTFGPGSYNVSKRGYPSDFYYNTSYEGRWNHFALVCKDGSITSYLDGMEMTTTNSAQFNTQFNIERINISDGNAEAMLAYSELRFWSVARTNPQIQRFKYAVDPNTKGLELYYQFNDDNNEVIKDWSHNGYNIDITETSSKIKWGKVKTNDDFTSFVTAD